MSRFIQSVLSLLGMTSLKQGEFVGALDCGTTSTRFIIFDSTAEIIAQYQAEFPQYYPHPEWHEHNCQELYDVVVECFEGAVVELEKAGWDKSSIKVIGITNQRETTVVWSRSTGKALYNAIVWDDARTKGVVTHYERKLEDSGFLTTDGVQLKGKAAYDHLKKLSGLPLSTYFSAIKFHWMLEHVPEVRKAYDADDLLFGTVDSWILYNLTKSDTSPGLHLTDPSNASRTLLLDIHKFKWSESLLRFFDIKKNILPDLRSNSEVYGEVGSGVLKGVKIGGMIGDQQAALVGNKCLRQGEGKNTYGTGAFLLFNTGEKVVTSKSGLISTVAYQAGPNAKPFYALEGSIAVAGSAIKWLRDGIGLIDKVSQINSLASQCEDTAGLYFVTAFSGLLAPYWDSTAGGLLIGLTAYTTPAHIARATMEAAAYQSRAIIQAMAKDSDTELKHLKVDGGMTNSDLAMQLQADIGGFDVIRPEMRESTALGSALLAGASIKLFGWDFEKPETLEGVNQKGSTNFTPKLAEEQREKKWLGWKKAVERSRGWTEVYESD